MFKQSIKKGFVIYVKIIPYYLNDKSKHGITEEKQMGKERILVMNLGSTSSKIAVYDDDKAFEYMMEKLQASFPEQKMYVMRFVEDYMEYDEAYLESAGLIDWE